MKQQFVANVCDNVTEISQTECQALALFYQSTDGPDRKEQGDRIKTNTPCSWLGVTCDAGHATQVALPSNQLRGAIPHEIADLASLQRLDLGGNQLLGAIRPNWAH